MRRPIVALTLAAALAAALAAPPARAQSKRYPPEPADHDRDDDAKSQLWTRTLEPAGAPYDDALSRARKLVSDTDVAATTSALDVLGRAIAQLPDRPEGYAARAAAYRALKDWARCADDFAAADARAGKQHEPLDPPTRARRRYELGICQSRAGRYADAEQTFARGVASHPQSGEAWLRLGEVRIALGKLDEAIDALKAALEASERPPQAMVGWLLALAHDRARHPEDADAAASEAARYDNRFGQIENPAWPLLGAGEREYLLALAYRTERGAGGIFKKPEYALHYFRRFLALAPADSPWRRRAAEHVRELAAIELPQAVEKLGGSAPLDLDAARLAVRRGMPALRACLAKTPNALFEIVATKIGPRTPDNAIDRPRYRLPPAGAAIHALLSPPELKREAIDDAMRCLEPAVARLALPAPKERDTHYLARFVVLGP